MRRLQRLREIQPSERVVLAFFAYLAVLGWYHRIPAAQQAVLVAAPMALAALWLLGASNSSARSKLIRQWTSPALILAGYWCLGWLTSPPIRSWEIRWEGWDRTLLDGFHLRQAIEATGAMVPSLLETVYLFLYVFPLVSLGLVCGLGARGAANRYLLVLLLGTFSAYALLPLFPVMSPRIAFPGTDLPHFLGTARSINIWILDHLDISTGVFPSGHVAVAFSSAFGLLAALRERRSVWIGAFAAATVVFAATVYGRYHYAADGLASVAIAFLAWRLSGFLGPDEA